MTRSISRVEVNGLHGRISFAVQLNSGLNIIYGKNGLGKTTLLHIIANVSEGDLLRFQHLNFATATIESNQGDTLLLTKNDKRIIAKLGQETILDEEVLADSNSDSPFKFALTENGMKVRDMFGGRSCYLPAFRSVLERSRESYGIGVEDSRNSQFEELVRAEELIQTRETVNFRGFYRDFATRNTALKTLRCRSWFGSIVPTIRYPSISDVAEGLSEEWSNANIRTNRLEQEQYEQAFLNIFEKILLDSGDSPHKRSDPDGDVGSQTSILSKISDLLNEDALKGRSNSNNATNTRLLEIVKEAGREGAKYNSVLEIYRGLLDKRKNTREEAYKPLIEFESAVNTFLDGKELRVGSDADYAGTRSSRGERVRIYPSKGKSYPVRALSSGERQIATMLFAASRTNLTPGCLLIDEPELSLHVDWQRHILKELIKQNPNRQIVACTHSPEVGADHKESIIHFKPTVFDMSEQDDNDDEFLGGECD